ncbi:MAG: metallophosphoesterase [Myxococcota bacterium]
MSHVHRFAVFGDVHGRLALMLTLARRWQREHDTRLDGILQVGDLAAYPDHTALDDATRRFAAKDPDELGFRDFLSDTPDALALLAPDDTPPVAFCRGNHEDFAYLEAFRTPTPLDPWRKLWFLPDGTALDWATLTGGPALHLAAFGGAPPLTPSQARGRKAREQRRKAVRRERLALGPRFRPDDLARALRRAPRAGRRPPHPRRPRPPRLAARRRRPRHPRRRLAPPRPPLRPPPPDGRPGADPRRPARRPRAPRVPPRPPPAPPRLGHPRRRRRRGPLRLGAPRDGPVAAAGHAPRLAPPLAVSARGACARASATPPASAPRRRRPRAAPRTPPRRRAGRT